MGQQLPGYSSQVEFMPKVHFTLTLVLWISLTLHSAVSPKQAAHDANTWGWKLSSRSSCAGNFSSEITLGGNSLRPLHGNRRHLAEAGGFISFLMCKSILTLTIRPGNAVCLDTKHDVHVYLYTGQHSHEVQDQHRY